VAVASYDNDATLKGSAMPKLKYNASWTEDDEVAIDEALGLTEEQGIKLFTQKGTIVITAEQATALVALADDDGGEKNEPEASPVSPEANPDGKQDAKEADKPDVVDVHITTQRERAASEAGKNLSEGTNKVLSDGFKARETVNITPLLTFLGMVSDLGKETVQNMPRPNTYLKGGKTMFGTGDKAVMLSGNDVPYDKYSVLDTSGKKPKKVAMSFYKIEARATKEGKRWNAELESVEKALSVLKENKLKTVPDGQWKGFAAPALRRRQTLFESRITFIQGMLGRAVKLAHQCYAFDGLQSVAYSFDQEEVEGKKIYVNCNEPVQIWDVTREKKGNETIVTKSDPINLSIGAFLKFDVAEAVKIAGSQDKVTYEILAKTIERDTQKDTPGTKEEDWSKHSIENVSQFENVMSSITSYISSGDGDVNAKHMTAIEKRIAEKDGEEFLLVMGDACSALDDFWTRFQKAYQAASAKRNAAKVAERQARDKIAA
jgi:hypothetical protein